MKIKLDNILSWLTLALVLAIPVSGIFSVNLFFILLTALCVLKFFDFLTVNFHLTDLRGFCFIAVGFISLFTIRWGFNNLYENELENGARIFVAQVTDKGYSAPRYKKGSNYYVTYSLNINGQTEKRVMDDRSLYEKVSVGTKLIMEEPLHLREQDRVLEINPSEELILTYKNGIYSRISKDTDWKNVENDEEIQGMFEDKEIQHYYSLFNEYYTYILFFFLLLPAFIGCFSLKISSYMILFDVMLFTFLSWYLRLDFRGISAELIFLSGATLINEYVTISIRKKYELKKYGGFFTVAKAQTYGSDKKESKITCINALGIEKTYKMYSDFDREFIVAFCVVAPNVPIGIDTNPKKHIVEKFRKGLYSGPVKSIDLELIQDDHKMHEPFRDSLRKVSYESEE